MKSFKFTTAMLSLILAQQISAQADIIEVDSIIGGATKMMPYNKSFTIKIPIDAEDMSVVHIIKKFRYYNLDQSIAHYIKKGAGTYAPVEIPSNYYSIRKVSDKNYLFLTFADAFLLEPSASYFIIFTHKKLGRSVLDFFDNYYASRFGPVAVRPAAASLSLQSLADFEAGMHKIFGSIQFGFYSVADYTRPASTFHPNFIAHLLPLYTNYSLAEAAYNAMNVANAAAMSAAVPDLTVLSNKELLVDATMNKEVLAFLLGKEFSNNNMASDLNTLAMQARFTDLLQGNIALDCIFCNPIDPTSTLQNDISKRISNIDTSLKMMNNLKRVLYLLLPRNAAPFNIPLCITNIINSEAYLLSSKSGLKSLLKSRKEIEAAIVDNVYDGFRFNYASMASGNCYMNFETRNKVLLTPDFGIVTPAITKPGKDLDYGIVPYLGFHINLMAVDRDLVYTSYKKNWKQYFSIMVGWSLVNLHKDEKYDNFFEKSSLLTGVGFRLSNVIRITAGSQWLFKLGKDDNNDHTRKLKAIPYIGLSFDLNIKQYINGFTDLLSGIGKTKAPPTTITVNQ
jgi:hypothetical protein